MLGDRLREKNEVFFGMGGGAGEKRTGIFLSFDFVGESGRMSTMSESVPLPGIHKCPMIV